MQIVTLTDAQKIDLVNTLIQSDLAIAAILFGVLGFLYTVYAAFAQNTLSPEQLADETKVDLRTSPLLPYLRQIGWFNIAALGMSLVVTFGCFVWLAYPSDTLLLLLSVGTIAEAAFLFLMGCYIVHRLMPVYDR